MRKKFTSSTQMILKEVKKRGIKIETIFLGHLAKLTYKNHTEYLYHQFISKTTAVAYKICEQKEVTKILLSKNDISVAKGQYFDCNELKQALDYAEKLTWPLVLKPANASHGDLLFANIKNKNDFKKAWEKISQRYETIIIEEMFKGKEYRIFATKDRLIAITYRMPANVIGDGKYNIEKLIKIKNNDPRRSTSWDKPLVKIKIDTTIKNYLKKQNFSLNSIPKKGKRIFLRDNSNISTGGDSFDYTDKADSSVAKIAVKIIKSIPGLQYGGIDFMCQDITKAQTKNSYIILEVNKSPGIDIHHFPYQGKSRDAARAIIDIAFPETKK